MDADRIARDTVAHRHAKDVHEDEVAAAEAAERAREAAKRAALQRSLESQLKEKELFRQLEIAEKEALQAFERQEVARRNAEYAMRKAALADKAFRHREELEQQRAGEEYNKAYGYDRAGNGVSEAEWVMNHKLLASLKGAAYGSNAPATPATATTASTWRSVRSSRRADYVAQPRAGGLAGLGVSGRSMGFSGRTGASTSVRTTHSRRRSPVAGALTPLGSSARPPYGTAVDDVGQLPFFGTRKPMDALTAMGSGYPSVSDTDPVEMPYHGRAKVEWYDK